MDLSAMDINFQSLIFSVHIPHTVCVCEQLCNKQDLHDKIQNKSTLVKIFMALQFSV